MPTISSRWRTLALLAVIVISRTSIADADLCFKDRFLFFKNFLAVHSRVDTKIEMLKYACNEIEKADAFSPPEFLDSFTRSVKYLVAGGLTSDILGAFAKLNGSDQQRDYQRKLDEIRLIPDRMTRISRVYSLAVNAQGHYDNIYDGQRSELHGLYIAGLTAPNIIQSAVDLGAVNVCRQFARLLSWSLLQVARFSNSPLGTLGPTDFNVEEVDGWVRKESKHAWVRVHLPQFNQNGELTSFSHFDLDPTMYQEFTPLFPRMSSLSRENMLRVSVQCNAIEECLKHDRMSQKRVSPYDYEAK